MYSGDNSCSPFLCCEAAWGWGTASAQVPPPAGPSGCSCLRLGCCAPKTTAPTQKYPLRCIHPPHTAAPVLPTVAAVSSQVGQGCARWDAIAAGGAPTRASLPACAPVGCTASLLHQASNSRRLGGAGGRYALQPEHKYCSATQWRTG